MTLSIELIDEIQSFETENTPKKDKILLVENEKYLSNTFLSYENNSVYQTMKIKLSEIFSQKFKSYLVTQEPSAIILNIGTSDHFNLSLIRDIRSLFDGFLILISSHDNEKEQLEAFDLGIDDYLQKPTDSRILLMRIGALFRRKTNKNNQVELASLTIGDVCLQPKSQKCYVNSQTVKLTTFEFNLLRLLIEHQGSILSREQLYQTLLRRVYNGVERTLDVRMSQLREKLTLAGMKCNQIETVWGQGYMFNHIAA